VHFGRSSECFLLKRICLARCRRDRLARHTKQWTPMSRSPLCWMTTTWARTTTLAHPHRGARRNVIRPSPSFRRSSPWPDPELPLLGYYVSVAHNKNVLKVPGITRRKWAAFPSDLSIHMYHKVPLAFFRVRYSGSGYAAITSTSTHRFLYRPCTTRIQLHIVVWIEVGDFLDRPTSNQPTVANFIF
jgi:hypothetical protein